MKDYIKLDSFLKWRGVADSGGAAKVLVASGGVAVNGEVETRRGRKLRSGDRVVVGAETFVVELEVPASDPVADPASGSGSGPGAGLSTPENAATGGSQTA